MQPAVFFRTRILFQFSGQFPADPIRCTVCTGVTLAYFISAPATAAGAMGLIRLL